LFRKEDNSKRVKNPATIGKISQLYTMMTPFEAKTSLVEVGEEIASFFFYSSSPFSLY